MCRCGSAFPPEHPREPVHRPPENPVVNRFFFPFGHGVLRVFDALVRLSSVKWPGLRVQANIVEGDTCVV